MAFKKGQGGRPPGAANKASKPLRDVLDALAINPATAEIDLHAQRLHALTQSDDELVALKALALVLAYRYGKPTEHVQVAGDGGGPVLVKFVGV